jgi:hypothetical protein
MPQGFRGLIADEYTDWFRNPARDAGAGKTELYGFGSTGSNFMVGAIANSGSNRFGVFGMANFFSDSDAKSGFTSQTSSTPPFSSSTEFEYGSSSQEWGGMALYRVELSSETALGLSYEFQRSTNSQTANRVYSSPSPRSSSATQEENSTKVPMHSIGAGFAGNFDDAALALRAKIVFSSPSIDDSRSESETTQSTMRQTTRSSPTDLSTTGFLVGGEYAFPPCDNFRVRTLLEFSMTNYDAPVNWQYFDGFGDSVFRSTTDQVVRGNLDGTILDVIAGASVERQLTSTWTLYGGAVVNYVRNKYDMSEQSLTTSRFTSQTSTTTSSASRKYTIAALLIRLPIAAEFELTNALTFRGGVMPEFYSTPTSSSETRTEQQFNSTTKSDTESGNKQIRFFATLGASLHDDEYGEVHAAYGMTEKGFQMWSVAMRLRP